MISESDDTIAIGITKFIYLCSHRSLLMFRDVDAPTNV